MSDSASLRYVVTMENGRQLVVYAANKAAACIRIVEARESGKEIRDTLGAHFVPLRDMGGIGKVEQQALPSATPAQDLRKAPGA